MDARNRFLPDWFTRIRTQQIELPRFQRHEAWSPKEIADLIETVLRRLPAGAALILEVGDNLPFVSRSLVTAPTTGERTTELLLDGQQRLTALWRALNDTYEDRTYFVSSDPAALEDPDSDLVIGQSRWVKNGKRYPVWVEEPGSVQDRGLIPLRLLVPGDLDSQIDPWVDAASSGDQKLAREIDRRIHALRTRVAEFNLPFLALPTGTPKGVALDVFLKLNTSSVKLNTFDIIVAQVEEKTGRSLHDLIEQLRAEVPTVEAYGSAEKLVLDALALHQDRSPNQSGYWGLDFDQVVSTWDRTIASIRGAVAFLEEQHVYDEARLPTSAALSVLAGLWPSMPESPDRLGNARTILRKYVWRAFLTSRYEQAAATAALNDFRGLRSAIQGRNDPIAPILDDQLFPRPDTAQLLAAGWPKGRGILSRGILALSLRCGAFDIADGTPVSRDHIKHREYHHLFPAAILRAAGIPEGQIFRALNCALITWRTNRTVGARSPVDYLKARAEAGSLGEIELRRRLATHLIPADELMAAHCTAGDSSIQREYSGFLEARAALIGRAINVVWEGRELDVSAMNNT